MSLLAFKGGNPVRTKPFIDYNSIGIEEFKAVEKTIKKGYLSLFEGNYFAEEPFSFYGGENIQLLEKEWSSFYGVNYSIAVNSATSALFAAIGALGIGPGDEVIVSPYTMSASALCPLIYNAIPIFADIEDITFNLDPDSIEKCITERTKAIVVVHIMGHPCDMDRIMKIAKKYDLKVVEDCAQAHYCRYKGKYVGTIGNIGIFSLNVNKTIQTGEGGILVTNDKEISQRLQLIRNHGEIVSDQIGYQNLNNMFGYNYRMTEIEASIAREQLKKLIKLTEERQKINKYLSKKVMEFDFLIPPEELKDCDHVYYIYGMKYLQNKLKINRKIFNSALKAEGIIFFEGYVKPIYLQSLYQKQVGYGGKGCPFICKHHNNKYKYYKGLCPVAENMYDEMFIGFEYARPPQTLEDMEDVIKAIKKIIDNYKELI